MGLKLPHPWIPNSSPEVKKEMLRELGISDVMDLFNDVPSKILLKDPPKVGFGKPLTEYELRRKFEDIISRNQVFKKPPLFVGGGVCAHHIPAVVRSLIQRSEYYTSYTPYQAEIAQGLLQAIFEYQSLMAELYGVDIVNASMYNVSTAASEAVRMAARVTRRRKILISKTAHPEVIDTIRTWALGTGLEIIEVKRKEEGTDYNDLERKLDNEVAAVYLEHPNFFGALENEIKEIIELAHSKGALAIVSSNPLSLGILEPPGKLGADIVVGDAQPLGIGMNYGGPSAGILGIHNEARMLRQLPGRLIGATRTVDGDEIGYLMVLQTREQHIRRERATSNITTNSSLMALAAAFYISLLGASGLRKLAEAILGRTYYTINKLRSIEWMQAPAFEGGTYFREFPVRFKNRKVEEIGKELVSKGIHIGPYLGRFFSDLEDCSLICVTELHTRDDIDYLAFQLEEVGDKL